MRSTWHTSKTHKALLVIAILSLSATIVASIFSVAAGTHAYLRDDDSAALIATIMFSVILVVSAYMITYGARQFGSHILIMQNFAADNNFTFYPSMRLSSKHGFAFSVSRLTISRNVVEGMIKNRKFWLFEYRFNSGTGRQPYPNIFTVMMVETTKEQSETIIINKKGRLKMIRPRTGLVKFSLWPELDKSVKIYSQDQTLHSNLDGVLDEVKMKQLLSIHPKAEVQTWNKTIAVFIPGKPIQSQRVTEELFTFMQNLR